MSQDNYAANMKKQNHVNTPPPERVSLPEKVAHAYYSHGLICSSHPILVLCFAISVVLLCSYPLINLPLPGVVPIQTITEGMNSEIPDNFTAFSGKPYVYIQQIVLKTGVLPWLNSMTVHDAFRAPLYQTFPLLETIRNFQIKNGSDTISISNLCLHVESVKLKSSEDRRKLLPEYNCLILSPANFWQQSEMNFQMDNHLIGTIFNYHNIQKGKISLTELLFGISVKESGLKRHPMRSRPRTLKYAITLVLEVFDESYISGLRKKLESQYPLHITPNDLNSSNKAPKASQETLHIYYPGEFNIYELFPLVCVYTVVFLYIYFSLRKIEPVKSKIGIAFSAVFTSLSCLCMSLGLCFFFGLTVSLNGKEIFPYLVGIVGLENVLVITESITSTPAHLDVKIRVAQGLSREGWSITKNLLIQVTILTIGFGTFVTAIQELCILGIVGLVCDFFLQLCFFTTILSIDIHRSEANFDSKSSYYYHSTPVQKVLAGGSRLKNGKPYFRYQGNENKNMPRSKSHHNLTSGFPTAASQPPASYPANVLAYSTPILNKIPKRLRLVHIWASTRFFQRIFMVAMVGWMCFILYNGGFIQQVFQIDEIAKFHEKLDDANVARSVPGGSDEADLKTLSTIIDESSGHKQEVDHLEGEDVAEDMGRFRHGDQDPHQRLSLYHWPVLMSLYNISLTGKCITVLPAIRISHVVSPEKALSMRNPNEKMEHFQWKTLAVALDPLDFSSSDDGSKISSILTGSIDRPFVPRSPMEIALACILVIVSIFVLSYMTMVLYRCICSRNYAEWRSSWETSAQQESDTQVVLEAVPTSLEGHTQEIECLATDGYTIVSTCLGGHIRVWNSADGESISHINRHKYFSSAKPEPVVPYEYDLNHSDYESGSPPSRGEFEMTGFVAKNQWTRNDVSEDRVYNGKSFKGEMQLKPNFNFSDLKLGNNQIDSKKGFDFGSQYKFLISDRRASVEELEADERKSANSSAPSFSQSVDNNNDFERNHKRCSLPVNCENLNGLTQSYVNDLFMNSDGNDGKSEIPPVWCLDCFDNLIVVGCSNGRLEFWDSLTAKLKCAFEDGNNIGITAVKIVEDRVVAARLNGSLDFLLLDTLMCCRHDDWGFTSSRRTHVRTGSAGSALDWELSNDVKCRKLGSVRAHQQPITVLECENGRVVTGSQDHTLKVLRLEDHSLLYTLHGHCGPITCMFIDKMTPFLSGSGSQDGLLCVWDLLTGACIYSIQAHDGSITALAYSASYVISLGTDERLCVWERFLGHLLNTIHVMHAYCSSVVMLTHNLLITSKQGSLVMWDVRCGDPVRIVRLGDSDHSVFVKQILNLGDSVVCDYGNQLRIVKFPIITDKTD
ncbi:UNVERIFIED_CONTAM: hypothetical protein PYX00_004516 [Menopon gallinae]|uniref:Sterol regulatory element-binding protein cleavage-activating protein n=1 Tax=Menopon gallinae TaxID=328185 RepID=A0AAW2I5Y5_9NEOP